MARPKSPWFAIATTTLFAAGCGGGQKGAADPSSSGARAEEGGSWDESSSNSGSAEPTPESHCDDGTCTVCGEGICPKGYYCDESGQPACSWLPKCASDPTCSCIEGRLGGGCSCEERDGGLFVRCD